MTSENKMTVLVVGDVECMNCGKMYKAAKHTFSAQVGRIESYTKGKSTYAGLGIVGICLCPDMCAKLYPVIDLRKILWKLGYKIIKR